MKNIKGTLAYAGTHYLGWQKTKEGNSIEEILENTFSRILQEKLKLQAASRTDRGVHALEQVFNFFSQKEAINLKTLKKSASSLLPKELSLLSLDFAKEDFHPTLDCLSKEYCYFICNGSIQLPFNREFSWHYPAVLDLSLMQQAAAYFIGSHDFSAFTNERKEDAIRTIYSLQVETIDKNRFKITISGNRFLYKMVRNIMGTLVYIGSGKIPLNSLPTILEKKDRTQAGMTAPAHGLFLNKVHYF